MLFCNPCWILKENIKKSGRLVWTIFGGRNPKVGVNHVKLVVSLYYYVVLIYFFCLHDDDDYECSTNVSIGEKITKNFLFLQTSWMLYRSKVTGVFYIWYQSEVETLGPIGLKTLQHVSFWLTDELSPVTHQIQQARIVRLSQVIFVEEQVTLGQYRATESGLWVWFQLYLLVM